MLYDFTQKFDADKLHRYQGDLKKFVELKKIQKIKNAEEVDFSKYEDQIRRILDKYVSSEYVVELAKPLQISESEAFYGYIEDAELGLSDKSKAEAIAAQTKKTIKENYHRDPEFYRRFSEKIEKLIAELRDARKEDLKVLLGRVREYQEHVSGYEAGDIPDSIRDKKEYHPFFRNLEAELQAHSVPPDQLCEMVKAMYELIDGQKIVDWHRNIEVERQVRMELEDYLFDVAREEYGVPLDTDEIDNVITLVWKLAVENRE
jgi:type I restriction enzyme R subunit